jgi:hypothetical protein
MFSKQAPEHWKASKAERKLLEELHKNRWLLMDGEPTIYLKCHCFPVRFSLFLSLGSYAEVKGSFYTHCSFKSGGSQTYYRYDSGGRKGFEEMKDIFQIFYPCRWMEAFQKFVDNFIQDRLLLAANIMAKLVIKEEDRVHLHGLRCLVAGTVQEGELVQRPKCHVAWAKLDGIIMRDGQGYVLITCLVHLASCSAQN